MNRRHFRYYSQNETINESLIRSLVSQTSISKGDLVYDIGAGSGNITEALLEKGARVIGIEKDRYLYHKLERRFFNREAVSLHHADFLNWEFSGHRYKVFSNIPFIQTADIVKKLLFCKSPPEDCYLIMQKEAALKYTGIPKETLMSLLIKPLFWVEIIYYFKRKDFFPPPSIDIVLVQFEKRRCRLVPESCYDIYRDFIVYCREGSRGAIGQVFKDFISAEQSRQIAAVSGLDLRTRPAELNMMQYLCVFQFLIGNNLKNLSIIQDAEERHRQKRENLRKIHRTSLSSGE